MRKGAFSSQVKNKRALSKMFDLLLVIITLHEYKHDIVDNNKHKRPTHIFIYYNQILSEDNVCCDPFL